jgi:IclR family KDG regulon transcriptional repressor
MEKETTGVIIKTLEVLEAFLKERETEIGISNLANLTGLKISTVHRIATILVSKGYLKQLGKRGKYTLGLKFLEFNNAIKRNLRIRDIARPVMERLRIITGESANLAISGQDNVVYIEHVDSNQTLRTFTQVGNRAPLYCTGVGKIFLANMKEEQRALLAEKSFTRYTDNTITDLKELEKELYNVRKEDIAMDNGEMEIGVRCIAAPIRSADGEVIAALSISGPYTRLNNNRIEELKPLVRNHALEISRILGYFAE